MKRTHKKCPGAQNDFQIVLFILTKSLNPKEILFIITYGSWEVDAFKNKKSKITIMRPTKKCVGCRKCI